MHWLDSGGRHSRSAVFTNLLQITERISPSYKKSLGLIRSFRGYVTGVEERLIKQENFTILSECCAGQKTAPKWVPGMIRDYYDKVVNLDVELQASDPTLSKSLSHALTTPLPQLMGEAFSASLEAQIQSITALPERSHERRLREQELREKWNEVFDTIVNHVKQSLGAKAQDIPSLRGGHTLD